MEVVRHRHAIESRGTQVAFVHMSAPEEADRWFARYGADDVVRISDPGRALYRQFGLEEASLRQLAPWRVWWPWLRTAVLKRRGFGPQGSAWKQLTGAFVVHRGCILAAVRHRNAAERPDYVALVRDAQLENTIR